MARQPRSLAGETAVISGGARGIGRCTAEALLRQGMRVALGDVDLATAQQTAAELGPSTVAARISSAATAALRNFAPPRKSTWPRARLRPVPRLPC